MRTVDQRPADAHALLLPPRKLGGAVLESVFQAKLTCKTLGACIALLR